ncbi:MAG: hypothetical protein AABW59_02435 [archaeon]
MAFDIIGFAIAFVAAGLSLAAIALAGYFAYFKLMPSFNEAVKEIVPYPKTADFILKVVFISVVVLVLVAIVAAINNAGLIPTEFSKLMNFISAGTGFMSDIISKFLDIAYFAVLLLIGVALMKMADSRAK